MSQTEISPRARRLSVGDAMHAGVLTCDRDAPLTEVAQTMARERVHCLVVISGGGEVGEGWGIVSDLDLVAAALVRDMREQTAGASAASPVVVVTADESLERAAQLMTENCTAHLLVVDRSLRPVGVLSTIDVASALVDEELG